MSIPCCAQTDTAKFCFTSNEMGFFVGAVYDATAYKKVSDSLGVEILNLNQIAANSSTLLDQGRELVETKNIAILASDQLSDDYKAQKEKETRRKERWKKSTFITSGVAMGLILYQFIAK